LSLRYNVFVSWCSSSGFLFSAKLHYQIRGHHDLIVRKIFYVIEECIGCGSCIELCPEVFELKDDKAWVIGPDKCNTCNCQEAVDICPVQAITWSEE
ncbi:MAG: ferredoxin, partial [Thermodesulfovibrionales bacterium]